MDAPIRVDLGTDNRVPLVFTYAKRQNGFLTKLAGETLEPALLLAMHPMRVIELMPRLQWVDLFRTGKVNAMHVVCGEWGESLTLETSKKLGITMETLVETGLTWSAIALAKKKPQWYADVVGATSLNDFAYIPGTMPLDTLDWMQEDIETALGLPPGAIEEEL
jgi:hypothetical protein